VRLLHYLEIENFKRFGDRQRIELDHPAVLIGPNNCGKTSAIQALALWSQAVRTWYDARKESSATKRTATGLNRLNTVAVPVQRTRFFLAQHPRAESTARHHRRSGVQGQGPAPGHEIHPPRR
jgi:recombinational DNA repair ATPase RecF